MTLTLSPRRLVLAAALAAFALTLAALTLIDRAPAPRPAADVSFSLGSPGGGSTDQRLARALAMVRAEPRSADALTTLAGVQLQKARETFDPAFYGRAEVALRRALALRPGDPGALTARGTLRLARHDFQESLAAYDEALKLRPNFPEALEYLGEAYVKMGRMDDARRVLNRLRPLDPGRADELAEVIATAKPR